jgi:sialate O-acetylesterase
MAVTMDIGNPQNVHPKNKLDVGKRLALWALAKDYRKKGTVYSGPLYKSMRKQGDKIRLYFNHTGSGLITKDGKELTHFTIAAEDKNFVQAKAIIDGKTIVVSSEEIKKPVAVRYAWSNTAQPNLSNKEGLPASSFRTDNWPGKTYNER